MKFEKSEIQLQIDIIQRAKCKCRIYRGFHIKNKWGNACVICWSSIQLNNFFFCISFTLLFSKPKTKNKVGEIMFSNSNRSINITHPHKFSNKSFISLQIGYCKMNIRSMSDVNEYPTSLPNEYPMNTHSTIIPIKFPDAALSIFYFPRLNYEIDRETRIYAEIRRLYRRFYESHLREKKTNKKASTMSK